MKNIIAVVVWCISMPLQAMEYTSNNNNQPSEHVSAIDSDQTVFSLLGLRSSLRDIDIATLKAELAHTKQIQQNLNVRFNRLRGKTDLSNFESDLEYLLVNQSYMSSYQAYWLHDLVALYFDHHLISGVWPLSRSGGYGVRLQEKFRKLKAIFQAAQSTIQSHPDNIPAVPVKGRIAQFENNKTILGEFGIGTSLLKYNIAEDNYILHAGSDVNFFELGSLILKRYGHALPCGQKFAEIIKEKLENIRLQCSGASSQTYYKTAGRFAANSNYHEECLKLRRSEVKTLDTKRLQRIRARGNYDVLMLELNDKLSDIDATLKPIASDKVADPV